MGKIDSDLKKSLSMLMTSMGYELIGVELLGQRGRSTLRIYIDKPNGVTIDDCSNVSHQVSAMLDVKDPIQGRYTLEVSSPGIDRPLFELEHFKRYIGQRVRIRLMSPIDKRKQCKGILKQVEGEEIHLLLDDLDEEMILPFSKIEKANLIGAQKTAIKKLS